MRLPRLEPIRYPALEGEDVVWGMRLSIPSYAAKGDATGWIAEVGKISDDSLKSHLVGNFVGCADNFYYFRLESPQETHTFLACLFLADMITRDEAESVLAKARSPRSALGSTIIHRLPSLATLGGAYWAGQSLTAEVLATSTLLTGASTTLLATAPVAAGCLAVGGAMMLFSRSARARGVQEEGAGTSEGGMDMILWEGARRRIDTALIRTLTRVELEHNPVFARLEEGFFEAEAARRILMPAPALAGSSGIKIVSNP